MAAHKDPQFPPIKMVIYNKSFCRAVEQCKTIGVQQQINPGYYPSEVAGAVNYVGTSDGQANADYLEGKSNFVQI